MQSMLDMLFAWSAAIGAVLVAALVLGQRPRALWRHITARDAEMPLWVITVMSLSSLAMWSLAIWHSQKIVEQGTVAPRDLGPDAVLDLVLGFIWRGFTGPVALQAHMQAAIVLGSIGLSLAYMAVRMRYSLFAIDIAPLAAPAARRVVVMGLSPLRRGPADEEAIAALGQLPLADAAQADVGMFPWQQNIRLLAHHLRSEAVAGRTRGWRPFWRRPRPTGWHVVLLPSLESAQHADRFVALAEACIARSGIEGAKIEVWSQAADYNSLTALRDAFQGIVRSVRRRPSIDARLDEISIDTTAGMKLYSIAGASVTFASPIEFTYVDTAAPNRVVAFDVRAEFRRRLRM